MQRPGVAMMLPQERQHGLQHLGANRRGGAVIQVDSAPPWFFSRHFSAGVFSSNRQVVDGWESGELVEVYYRVALKESELTNA